MCSTLLADHQDPFGWMQQSSYNPYAFGALPENFDQSTSSPRDWSWNAADGNFNSQLLNQSVSSAQQNYRPHRRAPSTSTMASLGSNSPYSQPTSLPYSGNFDHSGFYVDTSQEHFSSQFQKNLPTPTRTPTQDGLSDRNKPTVYSNPAMAAHKAMRPVMMGPGSWNGDAMGLPHHGVAHFNQELPTTPRTASIDDGDEQLGGAYPESGPVSQLDRSISNTYEDELYSPYNHSTVSNATGQAQRANSHGSLLSPHRNMLNLRLQEARSSASPQSAEREPSPFRQGSPFAASAPEFGQVHSGINTVARVREQQKAESDAMAYRQHHSHTEEPQQNTISPKDAMLEFENDPDEPAEDTVPSLFPENSMPEDRAYGEQRSFGPTSSGQQTGQSYQLPTSTFSFSSPSSGNMQTSNFNKFGFNLQEGQFSHDTNDDQPPDFPAHLVSMETSKSEPEIESHYSSDADRPVGTIADGGTYTCTYHGCTQRFSSPALLQKHKREGHRSAPGTSNRLSTQNMRQSSTREDSSSEPTSDASAMFKNSQAGPHRCDRINPSTGKPCNTIFSRPYDLTRHEDTIHNAQKKKVRCHLCTEEKTFSRSDALTRHMRVVHPEVDFPGKHRRRGGSTI